MYIIGRLTGVKFSAPLSRLLESLFCLSGTRKIEQGISIRMIGRDL